MFIVDFGPTTETGIYESMTKIETCPDDYILNHYKAMKNFEEEKQKFIDNQTTEST